MSAQLERITPTLLRDWPPPEPGAAKHSRGHVLVIAGTRSTPGAVLLAGIASLPVGAGVIALAVPQEVAIPLAIAVPEAAVTGWPEPTAGALSPADREGCPELLRKASAVLLGPRLDNPQLAESLLALVARELTPRAPIVLDAIALGVLPERAGAAATVAGHVVLTPNQDEAVRLLGVDIDDDADAAEVAMSAADKWQAVLSYHGHSVVTT
jgi:ADP-dependent NAD(P)H-hydrate dehydratase